MSTWKYGDDDAEDDDDADDAEAGVGQRVSEWPFLCVERVPHTLPSLCNIILLFSYHVYNVLSTKSLLCVTSH